MADRNLELKKVPTGFHFPYGTKKQLLSVGRGNKTGFRILKKTTNLDVTGFIDSITKFSAGHFKITGMADKNMLKLIQTFKIKNENKIFNKSGKQNR